MYQQDIPIILQLPDEEIVKKLDKEIITANEIKILNSNSWLNDRVCFKFLVNCIF